MALVVAMTTAVIAPSVAAPPPGAASCSGCHAMNGKPSPAMPSIYGRPADDTVGAMAAFRTGARPATVMNRIAKGFSDDEVRAIAAWLATQKQD